MEQAQLEWLIIVALLVAILVIAYTTYVMLRFVRNKLGTVLMIVENQHLPSKEEIAEKKADAQEIKNLEKEAQQIGKGY